MFPTAIHVAAGQAIAKDLLHALKHFHGVLAEKAKEWDDIIKIGRTHLADATPIRLGQEVSGYARQVELCIDRAKRALHAVIELPAGGTAVGTGDRARIKKDVKDGIPGWYNHYTAVGGDWSRMLIAANSGYKGLTMDRVLGERTKNKKNADLLDEFFDFLIEEGGSVSTVYDHHTEKDMNLAMQQPWCSIGSDGYAMAIDGPTKRGHPHPRSFGTFPRVLGVYVRQKGLLRLEDAVRKMTSQNAIKIGVHDRGILRPGMYADITIFDAETVIDRATYTDPFQYSVGIEYVLVNGQLVLDRGKHTGAMAGRALRMKAN